MVNGNKLKFEDIPSVDRQKDIAVLKVKGINNLPSLKMGDSNTLNTNNFVEAFGYSSKKNIVDGGKAGNQQHKLLREGGYILTIKPVFDPSSNMIYSTNQVNLGFSGGPIVDVNGNVTGIVSHLLPIHVYADSVICFSVPINYSSDVYTRYVVRSKTDHDD